MPVASPRVLLGLTCSLLLFGCGVTPTPDSAYPDSAYEEVPWTYTAPVTLQAQALTPGTNTLQHETVLYARNGYGPVEKNRSNGERAAGDGQALTLNGRVYAQGYGVHANSELKFSLQGTNGAQCTRFTADIGVDDEVGHRGSVVFQVFLDGTLAYQSGVLTGSSATRTVDLDIFGKQELRLVVTDAGNGISYDHADWADPRIYCDSVSTGPGGPGTPDPGFGQGGRADFASVDAATAADGTIYGVTTQNGNMVLRRRQPGGSVQQVTTDLGGTDVASAVKVQADGKVVVVGSSNLNFAVLRFHADLTPDASFGSGGRVVTDLGGVPELGEVAADVAVQPDGRLVVVGTIGRSAEPVDNAFRDALDFALVRYLPNGTLDPSFGVGGKTFTSFDDTSGSYPRNNDNDDIAKEVALQPDGKIMVVGDIVCNGPVLARYTVSGSLDTTFAGDGSFGGAGPDDSCSNYWAFNALAVQGDGRTVVVGWAGRNQAQASVSRFTRDGRLETTREFDFIERLGPVINTATALVIQADGKIVVGGYNENLDLPDDRTYGYALARLDSALNFDLDFGGNGTGRATFASNNRRIHSLLQPGGKIVAAGPTFLLGVRP